MAYLRAVGCFLPARVVDNTEVAKLVDAPPEWIVRCTGIEQRRFASAEETVASLGVRAAQDCLAEAGVHAREIGLLIVASGSSERRFPGPASAIGAALGIPGVPALDISMPSAGSLFGLAFADRLARSYRNVLVIGSEIMSRVIRLEPAWRDTAVLFGDGAGAALVSAETGFLEIVDSLLWSDGEFSGVLQLGLAGPLQMDGRAVILHASRKLPRAITELLERCHLKAQDVAQFLLHQANVNLIARVAQAVGVPENRFFRNLARYGNTSAASLLIAAAEWRRATGQRVEAPVIFSAFGAGLNWGALLARPSGPS